MQFPFPADTINSNRFHGVIQGTFELENGTLRLRTPFGLIRLYPRPAKDGKRPFRAAYLNLRDNPGAGVNVYGYPRTNEKGIVERLEMVSFHMVGSPDPDGPLSVSRRFQPNEMFLCGRVGGLENGLVNVKVKSVVGDRDLSWRVTGLLAGQSPQLHSKVLFSCALAADGLLVVRPLKVISLPGRSTSGGVRSVGSSGSQVRRISADSPPLSRSSDRGLVDRNAGFSASRQSSTEASASGVKPLRPQEVNRRLQPQESIPDHVCQRRLSLRRRRPQ